MSPGPGEAARAAPEAVKRYRAGTHRVLTPQETLARVRPFFGPLGITRVANVTGLDVLGVPVVMVCRPNARSLSVTQGKGLDLASAQASGVMEAVEAWHAERIALPLRLARYEDLRYERRVVDASRLPRSAGPTRRSSGRTLWVEGQELSSGLGTLVPYEMVHLDYTLPLPEGSGAYFMSSSGLASGNHRLEALSHALCELIEHDATTLFRLGGAAARRHTRVKLDTVTDEGCQQVLAAFDRAGVLAAVWETSTDLGVASYLCTVADASPEPLAPLPPASGMGCHPSRAVALCRALTEAAQSRLTLLTGARDDTGPADHDRVWALEALGHFRATLWPEPCVRDYRDAPDHDADSLEGDVRWELERLHAVGCREAVAVELTREALGLPVVRVVVPGLEAIHGVPGYAPGARGLAARAGAL